MAFILTIALLYTFVISSASPISPQTSVERECDAHVSEYIGFTKSDECQKSKEET
jgi:hypothetical protein